MITPDAIRDDVLTWVENHERVGCGESPSGTTCWHARTNLLAYLCHALGVRGERLHHDVAALVGEYDLHCRDQSCKHELQ